MQKHACRHSIPCVYGTSSNVLYNFVSFVQELSNGSFSTGFAEKISTPLHWFKLLPGIQNWHMVEIGRCFVFFHEKGNFEVTFFGG